MGNELTVLKLYNETFLSSKFVGAGYAYTPANEANVVVIVPCVQTMIEIPVVWDLSNI